MHNQIRAYLLDKIRDTKHDGWRRTEVQVWNKVGEKVHKYCTVRSSVNNSVIQHLLILKVD